MFELKETKSYDEVHRYGTDWITEYVIESDEDLDIDGVLEKLAELGKTPCGSNNLIKTENGYILKNVMY